MIKYAPKYVKNKVNDKKHDIRGIIFCCRF